MTGGWRTSVPETQPLLFRLASGVSGTVACPIAVHYPYSGGPDAVLELVARGIIRSDFRVASEAHALRGLMKKYAGVPMSLADSCLVRMTELDTKSVVITLDSDFRIYRRHRRQVVPTVSPGQGGD